MKNLLNLRCITRFELGNILKSRCFDEHRPDIGKLLIFMNLKEYNVYDMCRATHSRMAQDFIWFRYEGERVTWKDLNHQNMCPTSRH